MERKVAANLVKCTTMDIEGTGDRDTGMTTVLEDMKCFLFISEENVCESGTNGEENARLIGQSRFTWKMSFKSMCTCCLFFFVHDQVTIIFVVSVCLFVQSFSQPSLIRFRSNKDTCYMSGSSCVS